MKLTYAALLAIVASAQAASHMRGLATTTLDACNFIPTEKSLVLDIGGTKTAVMKFNECVTIDSPPSGIQTVKVMDGDAQVGSDSTLMMLDGQMNAFVIAPTTEAADGMYGASAQAAVAAPMTATVWNFFLQNLAVGSAATINGELAGVVLPEQAVAYKGYGAGQISTLVEG